MFGRKKSLTPRPRRRSPAAPSRCRCPSAIRARHPAAAAVPGGHGARDVRDGLLLGRGAEILAGPGVYTTTVGYAAGPPRTRPTGGLLAARPATTRSCCVVFDPRRRVRRPAATVLGEPRPDPGNAPGRRRRHAVPLGIYMSTTRSSEPRRRARRVRELLEQPATARSRPRSSRAAFYYAEDYHQQYLAKNPEGYCGLGGTGVACPIGLAEAGASAERGHSRRCVVARRIRVRCGHEAMGGHAWALVSSERIG